MQANNERQYKTIESEEIDSGDSWMKEKVHLALVIETPAGEVEAIKAWVDGKSDTRLCFARISKTYLYIVSQRPENLKGA
jgi:hypothetical protein